MFKKILVANRGEIAVRIMNTCKKLGIATVAVYSRADRNSRHVKLADEAVCIGPPPSSKSYLDQKAVLKAAVRKKAEAIHPGYGFLSENAEFAEECEKAGVAFIGPLPEAIRLMGDKAAARATMLANDLPAIPGTDGPVSEFDKAMEVAREVGYPVVVKASAGGGGRGMRIAKSNADIVAAMSGAIDEAHSTFGNCEIYVEKFLECARHVEIQILADAHGNIVHLGERDCSVQRKHQKFLEESPAGFLEDEQRGKMTDVAVRIAELIGYTGAGTVEFILDENGNFYFMEMNTRLQVEHPVTEMVTGVDIIEEQIKVARNWKLPFGQSNIRFKGHAVECRINAEDPYNGFMPCPGRIRKLRLPDEGLARVDTHVYEGYTVPRWYDSLIAKVIVYAGNRSRAIAKMLKALDEFEIEGVTTTIPFLKTLLQNKDVSENNVYTRYVEDMLENRESA